MLVYCRECGEKMSDRAQACPHCGFAYEADKAVADEKPGFMRACINGHKGRVCRRDYWLFFMTMILSFFLIGILLAIIGLDSEELEAAIAVMVLAFLPFVLLADIGRLHDVGFSGWWVIFLFIPLLGFIWWLFIAFFPSDKKANKWGKQPE